MRALDTIYRILKELEKAMSVKDFNTAKISAERLKISKELWNNVIELLVDNGYVKGVEMFKDITGELNIDMDNIRITIKGLEFLIEKDPSIVKIA